MLSGLVCPRRTACFHQKWGLVSSRSGDDYQLPTIPMTASPTTPPLPMTPEGVAARGWDAVDVVLVTGDAYVDHPSFANGLIARLLEAEGLRVAVLAQPDWHSAEPWRQFGRPRICFAVSAGNMDSMINHYTAARKVRNDDAYSPNGQAGRRPDRATLAYCQRAREAFPGVPVIAGGVEASLRRLVHYDYWSDKLRRSIAMDAKPDLLVYGMGERALLEIVRRLAAGEPVGRLHDIRGTAYRLGAAATREMFPSRPASGSGTDGDDASQASPCDGVPLASRQCPTEGTGKMPAAHEPNAGDMPVAPKASVAETSAAPAPSIEATDDIELPSYEQVLADPREFMRMTIAAHRESDPHGGRRLVQRHGPEAVVINPPALPLEQAELDRIHGLPYTRRPHPDYGGARIPAYEVVKESVQIMRGCFGGCRFCSLSLHQGRIIQSRGERSVLDEVARIAAEPNFSGTISDLGGPTANMYRMNCSQPETRKKCRRASCLHPEICPLLDTDHRPLLKLMRAVRDVPGVRRALIASGVRMDLAQRDKQYLAELVRHHTGGLLKVAPEHADADVLRLMGKPEVECFEAFNRQFQRQADRAGREMYLVPYFMSGYPGCDLPTMIRLAQYMNREGLRTEQVQEFIPAPMDMATAMYYTGLDPATSEPLHIPRGRRERRLQRAVLQWFKPEHYDDVRAALTEAGREDLIGDGPDCLIPARRPRAAGRASNQGRGKHKRRGGQHTKRHHRKTSRRR